MIQSLSGMAVSEKVFAPLPSTNVFPRRMPLAVMNRNVRTVITEGDPSRVLQEFPGPSAPAGQRMLLALEKPDVREDGEPTISAPPRGTGTKDVEKGVAPDDWGTFGFEMFWASEVLEPNWVRKDPPKSRLEDAMFGVMEKTCDDEPVRPTKGGGDQELFAGV